MFADSCAGGIRCYRRIGDDYRSKLGCGRKHGGFVRGCVASYVLRRTARSDRELTRASGFEDLCLEAAKNYSVAK